MFRLSWAHRGLLLSAITLFLGLSAPLPNLLKAEEGTCRCLGAIPKVATASNECVPPKEKKPIAQGSCTGGGKHCLIMEEDPYCNFGRDEEEESCFCPADKVSDQDACKQCRDQKSCSKTLCTVPEGTIIHKSAKIKKAAGMSFVKCQQGKIEEFKSSCSCPPEGREGWEPLQPGYIYKCRAEVSFSCEQAFCGIWQVNGGQDGEGVWALLDTEYPCEKSSEHQAAELAEMNQ